MLHTCSSECVAPSDAEVYFYFCECVDGCSECSEGKVSVNECPYEYVDIETSVFKEMYDTYKAHLPIYNTFTETPHVLAEYFRAYEVQLIKYQKYHTTRKEKKKDIVDKINKRLNA
jgi:hypothetical protein